MSQQQVLEGTWEQILLHAGELAGKKVSLTILDSGVEVGSQPMEPGGASEQHFNRVLQDLFREAENIEAEPGKPGSDPYETAFGRIVTEKYRKQGFDI